MKRKVAIYARVSSEHEAQLSALDNQVQYYDNIIAMTENLFKSLPGTFIESKNPHQKIRRVLGIDPGLANTGFGIV